MVLFQIMRHRNGLRHRRKVFSLFCYFIFLASCSIFLNCYEYHFLSSPLAFIPTLPWLEEPSLEPERDVHNPMRNGLPLFDPDECREPLHEWQDSFYPNCNTFHAIDFMNDEELELLGVGGARMVWKVNDVDGNGGALKTMIYKSAVFDQTKAEHTRIDSILSERLTSSPHVINIYGACGLSTMSEVGVVDDKWVTKMSTSAKNGRTHRTKLEKLDLARQLAHALADFHAAGTGNDENATAVWRNLKSQNILFVNGKLKINDFDDSILFRKNATDGSACKFQLDTTVYENKTYQPPELCFSGKDLDAKVDIYALGGILYQLLTRSRPYNDIRDNQAELNRRKRVGILPSFEKVKGKNDTVTVAFQNAVEQCMKPNPKDRPTARQVANELDRVYEIARNDKTLQTRRGH